MKTTIAEFSETAQFIRVLYNYERAIYEVIGIDGRVLFDSQNVNTAVAIAQGFEDDYATTTHPEEES